MPRPLQWSGLFYFLPFPLKKKYFEIVPRNQKLCFIFVVQNQKETMNTQQLNQMHAEYRQKAIAMLLPLSVDELKKMAVDLSTDYRDEVDFIFPVVLDVLSETMPEAEFIPFANSL